MRSVEVICVDRLAFAEPGPRQQHRHRYGPVDRQEDVSIQRHAVAHRYCNILSQLNVTHRRAVFRRDLIAARCPNVPKHLRESAYLGRRWLERGVDGLEARRLYCRQPDRSDADSYSGPNAQELLSWTSINNVYKWPIGTSKHLVSTDADGLIVSHGLTVRDAEDRFRQFASGPWAWYQAGQLGEDRFRQFASGPWAWYQAGQLGLDVEVSVENIFILQIAGPKSIQLIERMLGRNIRDLALLAIQSVKIAGIEAEIELSRIGMVGTLAYEIRGPFEAGAAVFDAAYRAGQEFNVKRMGWRTYAVNHTEGGFPQSYVSFTSAAITDSDFMNAMGALPVAMTGSAHPSDARARFRTPQEVNWAWMAKFNHDFIGREALEREAAEPKRKTVILRWNADDVLDVFASHLRPGPEYKFIEFPSAPQQPAGGHADLVTKDGSTVGYSSAVIYSYYYRELISQCVIDLGEAEIGNEVVVHWGDHGGPIKEIRATVQRFPYLDLPNNRDYDLSTVPHVV